MQVNLRGIGFHASACKISMVAYCEVCVDLSLFHLMFYSGPVKYQEVDGQLQRYQVLCKQRQILDQQAVA